MGNCHTAEAATVIIQHPGKKVERMYHSVTARNVMSSNPGHFVALVIATTTVSGGASVKHLKLLRPDDVLIMGQVYRLVCVQDVLKEFTAKKCVKLAKLLEGGGFVIDKKKLGIQSKTDQKSENRSSAKEEQQHAAHHRQASSRGSSSSRSTGKIQSSGGQWKPALQSISEIQT